MDEDTPSTDPVKLRQRAERSLARRPASAAPGETDTQRLVHELRVHQIELEMQNETLREARSALESLAAAQAAHLHELAGELTRAEQRERDRLYELLHNEVQPRLVAARLSLAGLGVRNTVDDCLRIAADACTHIGTVIGVTRNLSLQLSPPLIRERGLNAALESLCRWVRHNHGQVVELDTATDAEPDDMALRLLCFNAVRELLINIVKHAGTTTATLSTRHVEPDTLRITVTDRGSGFDPAAATGGLAAIARRLGMIGGSMQVDSRPGHGTVTTLCVPLRPMAAWAGHERRRTGEVGHAQNPDRR